MDFNFKVNDDEITFTNRQAIQGNTIYNCVFTFSPIWTIYNKFAVFFSSEDKKYIVEIINNQCAFPVEVIKNDLIYIGVFGTTLDAKVQRISTNLEYITTQNGAYSIVNTPTADIWEKYLATIKELKAAALTSSNNAKVSEDNAKVSENNSKTSETTALTASAAAQSSATKSKVSEDNAKTSENNSKTSEITSSQAMTDLLKMIGCDIATLTNGKLTPSQIPSLSINDVFTLTNVNMLTATVAQRGDTAVIITNNIVTDTYMLCADDYTLLANWVKLGISYVAEAGNAQTANNATNSSMINNHRMVEMSQADFDNAIKDNNTYYLVW